MNKNKTYLKLHKPSLLGLCFSCLYYLSFLGATSMSLMACGTGNDIIVKNDTSSVAILKPTDIKDYAKYYKPQEFKDANMLRSDSKWSFVRSNQSTHFIVFWESGFGNDPNAATLPDGMRVDIDDLLKKAESFYDMNVNTLKYAELGKGKSNLDKYKMQIYLLYQADWLAVGAGYDDVIGALWVNPSTCKPVGSVIAHEIGHSFQYQIYADLVASGACANDFTRGFRYGFGGNGGNGFWEQTAQWQSFQSYPLEAFTSYNFGEYTQNYHRHIGHEFQRYASYFIHYYWVNKHGIDFIGKLWREAKSPEDPIQTYMRMNGLTVEQLNAEMYDAATKFVTWDLDAIRTNGSNYIGKHAYKFYQLADGTYQVAYSRCPGTTGYNVIPLNVPTAGTVVKTSFSALTPGSVVAPGDPGQYTDNDKKFTTANYNSSSTARSGWRYGYVALLSNGQRIYGEMNQKNTSDVQFTVPIGCTNLWFVVLGAPNSYSPNAWDEKESNDDQWPYKVKFVNTNLLGSTDINYNDTPKDLTLSYNVSFAVDAAAYSGTTINLNTNGDVSKVAQALVMQPSTIIGALLGAKAVPVEGKIAYVAIDVNGSLNYNTTANGYGFWNDSQGNVIVWGSTNDCKLYSEFKPDNFEFTIGQYPGKSKVGDKYTIKNALVYIKDGKQYQITLVFNVSML